MGTEVYVQPVQVSAFTAAPLELAWSCFTEPAWITRWNAASEDWSCPEAVNDLRVGGAFSYRMAARDGSAAFDFSGTWEEVGPRRLVQRLDDGRRVEVGFAPAGPGTVVTETFDPEGVHPLELQRAGWQAVLDRFAAVAGGHGEPVLARVQPCPLVGVRRQIPVAALAPFFGEVFPRVMGWVQSRGVVPATPPMAVWYAMDPESGVADCLGGVFLAEPAVGEGEVVAAESAGGDVLVTTHTGPYSSVPASWRALYSRAAALGRTPGLGWEVYVDDPEVTPAERLRTAIYLSVG